MTSSFETPLVLLVFNRPELTAQVLARIAGVRPAHLYVVADGARPGRSDDIEAVAATRSLLDSVDWPCQIHRNYSDTNLGCKRRISSGLDWVFETAQEAIILEDDCIPDPSFFPFCQELLSRYKNDPRIMAVSGDNFQGATKRSPYSYYFSKYPHCWGWATWRRAWRHFDVEMTHWPAFRADGALRWMADVPEEEPYWDNIFEQVFQGKIDSWAYIWQYVCWSQSGLTILPEVNLVSNVGFGDEATHTRRGDSPLACLPTEAIGDLNHPPYVMRHVEADRYSFENVFTSPRGRKRLRTRLKRFRRALRGMFVSTNSELFEKSPNSALHGASGAPQSP